MSFILEEKLIVFCNPFLPHVSRIGIHKITLNGGIEFSSYFKIK